MQRKRRIWRKKGAAPCTKSYVDICEQPHRIWISSWWSQERERERRAGVGWCWRGGWEGLAWECPTVKFRACRLSVFVGELGWSLHRVTRLSQSSAITQTSSKLCKLDTHIHMQIWLQGSWYENSRSGGGGILYLFSPAATVVGIYSSSMFYRIREAAFVPLPHSRCPPFHFFQEQCLRRCIQETVASAHFLCDRCAMEAWQLLSCSLFPSLYSSLLYLPLSSQLQQRAVLFVLTSLLLPADLWSTKDLELTLATCTHHSKCSIAVYPLP